MSGFIDKTSNIDAAELAAEYRTPDQGVSAKSNSNIIINDYRKMAPRRNQSDTLGQAAIVPSGTTQQFRDYGGTCGFVPSSRTYTTGSSKGATSYTHIGVATSQADQYVSVDSSSASLGNFGLGNSGGTGGLSLANVASFPSSANFVGLLNRNVTLGGVSYLIATGANGASNWTTLRIRNLYPGGSTNFGGSSTFYNGTTLINRSDGWAYTTSSGFHIWSRNYGIGTSYTSMALGFPSTIEIT
jgi:hypothetical protein|tara:strand:- start:2355 stop:3083 length:729 start_codon:yes stop_codon:yes gene_type:complete